VPADGQHALKVILETGALPDDSAVASSAALAISHGADFVKTSTGKIQRGATLDATAAILRVIHNSGHTVGLKASGGIRTLHDAQLYLEQADDVMGPGWATSSTFRIGASSLVDALLAALDEPA
jgi:deoxyribose-phosphate aldolase